MNNQMMSMMSQMMGGGMSGNNPMAMIMQMMQSKNPMAMMQQMAQSNPQAAQAMQMIRGKNPKQLEQIARNMAKERGISVDEMIQQMGFKK